MSIRRSALRSDIEMSLLRDWVAEAGRIALSRWGQIHVDFKSDGTPITSADREIESYLVDRISEHYPHDRILSEEQGGSMGSSEFLWAIDPIDGSRAFASGLPLWGISVGVLQDGKAHTGVFYMPAVDEMYWNGKDQAFLNHRPIAPHLAPEFDDPLAFLAVPSNAHRLYRIDYPRVRSLGSTAAHLAYVARGAAIGALTRRVRIWDLAGVLPILGQTGGTLVYLSGDRFDLSALVDGDPAPAPIVAAPKSLVERVRSSIQVRS